MGVGSRARKTVGLAVLAAAFLGSAVPGQAIVGGTVASAPSWPWAVFVYDSTNDFLCSGVMISNRVVATAAHCVVGGQMHVTSDDLAVPGSEFVDVTDEVLIPSYDENDFGSPDVAKLTLAGPVAGTTPIELIETTATAEIEGAGAKALVAGYGTTSSGSSDSEVLREAAFSGLDRCEGNNWLCTATGPPWVCHGDSGAPLIVQLGSDTITVGPNPDNGDWRLAGLVSATGAGCTDASFFTSILDQEQNDFLAPPDTEITKAPKRKTEKRKATFEFVGLTSGSGASFQCSLDGKPFEACVSPHKTGRLKKGKHTFEVWASADFLDDLSPAKHTWKVTG